MKKISIIMPAYNSEKTIKRSIESVIQQTYSNLELIIVNDGSTDNTEQIVRDIAEKDKRIHYIYKKNGGVSTARNVGLEQSNGEFIAFIDSDDCYQVDMLSFLMTHIERNNCDFISCSYERVSTSYKTSEVTYIEEGFYDKKQLETIVYPSIIADESLLYKVPLNIVTKIFRKELIDKYNIRFNEDLHRGEDLLFCREYFLCAESFYYLPHAHLYKYLDNESSATNSFVENRKEAFSNALNSPQKILDMYPQYNFAKQIPYSYVRIALSSTANIVKYMKGTKEEVINELRIILDNEKIIEACHTVKSNNFDIVKKIFFILIKNKKYTILYLITKYYKVLQ